MCCHIRYFVCQYNVSPPLPLPYRGGETSGRVIGDREFHTLVVENILNVSPPL